VRPGPPAARPPWRSKAAAVDRAAVAVVGADFKQANSPLQSRVLRSGRQRPQSRELHHYAGTMTSRLFGQPTSASQARRVQLGFQFRF